MAGMAGTQEMQEQNAKNMKDFLLQYNKITEGCFNQCVTGFNEPVVTAREDSCVGTCTNRYIKYNQKLMMMFMEVQNAKQEAIGKELELAQKEGRPPNLPGLGGVTTPPEKVTPK